MASGIVSIGPLTIDELIEPTTINLAGPPNVRGGLAATISTAFVSRTLVEQLESLVNNPRRRQQIAGAEGVLEWVETSSPLGHWRGWWLLSSVAVSYDKRQFLQAASSAYLPVQIAGVYFGESVIPIVSATFRAKPNNFSVTGTALTPSAYPMTLLDASGATEFTRAGNAGTVGLYVASDTRRVARMDATSLVTAYTDARPALIDSNAVAWYGPRVEAVNRIQTALFRVTLRTDGAWDVDVRIPSAPTTWTSLGILGVYESASAASVVVGSRVLDDSASLTVMDTSGHYYTMTIRHGDYGVRILSTGFTRWIDSAAAYSALSANYYLESSAGPGGGKRLTALVNTAAGTDLANGKVQIGADKEAFFGFEPASAATNDTAVNQGKQFIYDRNALLTVE